MQKFKETIHVHKKRGKHHILANSVMAPYFYIYANRNKAEPRGVTKQVVWIILRNRIFHGTIRHIRSGFPSYARTLCALTLLAYALKRGCNPDDKYVYIKELYEPWLLIRVSSKSVINMEILGV